MFVLLGTVLSKSNETVIRQESDTPVAGSNCLLKAVTP